MNMAVRATSIDTYLKWPNRQVNVQTEYPRQVLQLVNSMPINTQELLLLPFQLLLRHLEAAILHELELACRISSDSAMELDNAFKVHIEKFMGAISAEFERFYYSW